MSERPQESNDETLLARLLQTAGRGPKAAPEARARVYAAVRERWQAALPKRAAIAPLRPSSRNVWVVTRRLALAASLALAAVVVYQLQAPQSGPPAPFASVAKIEGNVTIRHKGDPQATRLSGPVDVRIGDTMTTDAGSRMALRLENGSSLRVNSDSEVEVLAGDRITLRSGTVYFDSDGTNPSAAFAVETSIGSVRHIGTQFEASLVSAGLRIRVREGAVRFSDSTRDLLASAGEEVRIESAGPAQRAEIAPDDAAWAWAVGLATLPVAAQYPLPEVLTWVSRETSREVSFADPTVEARAQTVVLYDLDNLTPRETLTALRVTTAFEYDETDDGLLIVSSNR